MAMLAEGMRMTVINQSLSLGALGRLGPQRRAAWLRVGLPGGNPPGGRRPLAGSCPGGRVASVIFRRHQRAASAPAAVSRQGDAIAPRGNPRFFRHGDAAVGRVGVGVAPWHSTYSQE